MTEPVRVLLLENIHASAHGVLEAGGLRVEAVSKALKEDELVQAVKGVQLLGIRSKTRITPRVLEAATDLMAVGAFCIGTNQVALDAARASGVPVFNAPFSNTRSVAELVLAEIVALARQLGDRSREVHAGTWKKVATGCYEVRGKTLGIVGYGHIGRQVGVLAEAFGMRVLFFDVRSSLPMGNNRGVGSLDDVLAQSDFVTLHVPETPQTKDMMDARALAAMKPGAYLINASRGTVVDIPALAAVLRSGHLAGAAIDVYPEEPESNADGFASELQGLGNVILTPHVGGSTVEAQEAIGREVANALTKFVHEGTTAGSVNFPQIEAPLVRGSARRVLNVHRNVPGVLRDINQIVSDLNVNIRGQVLATDEAIGYLVMDMDQDVSSQVCVRMGQLETSIKTRVVA